MSVCRVALLSSTALVSALLLPTAGTATAQTASTSLQASYTCAVKFWLLPDAEPFPMALDADVTALRSGPAVKVTMAMGKPILALDDPLENVGLSTDLKAAVNGTSTTLVGNGTVSFLPDTPVDLPVLTTTLNTSATSLRLTPGALTLTVDYSTFKVPINCTLDAPVTITVPVTDPDAPVAPPTQAPVPTQTPGPTQTPVPTQTPGPTQTPVPTPTPTDPAPAPDAKQRPVLKVSLTRKTQKFRKAPAKVKVSLKRAKKSTASPRGTVVVKVGKRTVARVKVKGPKSFRVPLPRNIKVGKHTVKVVFTPNKKTPHKKTSRSVKIRVKR